MVFARAFGQPYRPRNRDVSRELITYSRRTISTEKIGSPTRVLGHSLRRRHCKSLKRSRRGQVRQMHTPTCITQNTRLAIDNAVFERAKTLTGFSLRPGADCTRDRKKKIYDRVGSRLGNYTDLYGFSRARDSARRLTEVRRLWRTPIGIENLQTG